MTNEAREAEECAARFVADMPEGTDRELCRLACEAGYLRGALSTRTVELRVARERIAELEAALRGAEVLS